MDGQAGERGQAAILAAGLLLLLLVIAAVALDVGWWLHDKRDAQNDVDAAALAGAQDLPDQGAASADALAWATKNDVAPGDLQPCEFEDRTGDGQADLIRCRVERDPGSLESGLLDIGIITIKAKAAAARMRAVAGCTMPWAVIGNQQQGPPGGTWGLVPQTLYGFHTSDFVTPGNFGGLRLYGNGNNAYVDAIENPCGSSPGGCANGEPVPVGETLQCNTQTGDLGSNTDKALTWRDTHYGGGTRCDATTYGQALQKVETDPGCTASRVVLIPIIIAWPPNGHGPVHILGLANFYIAGWDRKSPYKGIDVDGDTKNDLVWGYFLEDMPIIPAWEVQWGYTDDPFAPINILLVE